MGTQNRATDRPVMLSELLRFTLVDGQGRHARLVDLDVDVLKQDYPPVTRLIFKEQAGEQMVLPWNAVQGIDRREGQIRVSDLGAAEPAPPESLKKDALLDRDIQDALILDLQLRRAMRANDLQLMEEDGHLVLRAADTSPWAVLRRVSRGALGWTRGFDLCDWKYIEFLRGDPRAVGVGADYNRRITRLPPGEIAYLSDLLPYLHAAEIITLLPDSLAADTLEYLAPERQLQVFEELEEEYAARLLARMAPDEAADLVGRLDPEMAQRFLDRLPEDRANRIVDLLRYPADTVGGLMTNDIVVAPANLTVGEARSVLRDRLKEPDFVHFIYIVDDEKSQRLRGVITLRDVLVADEGCRLEEVMNPYLVTMGPLEDAKEAAYRLIDSHLAALPVVGRDEKLLGAVTIDAATVTISPRRRGKQVPKVFAS